MLGSSRDLQDNSVSRIIHDIMACSMIHVFKGLFCMSVGGHLASKSINTRALIHDGAAVVRKHSGVMANNAVNEVYESTVSC